MGSGRGWGKLKPKGPLGRTAKLPDGSSVSEQSKIRGVKVNCGSRRPRAAVRAERCLSTSSSPPLRARELLRLIGSPLTETRAAGLGAWDGVRGESFTR